MHAYPDIRSTSAVAAWSFLTRFGWLALSPAVFASDYSNNPSPEITQQPASVSASPGQTITLKVSVKQPDGAGYYSAGTYSWKWLSENLLYQWKKDGITIAGATTDTLVMQNARAAHVGTYVVVVWWKDSNESVTSSPAEVTVGTSQLPTVLRDPVSQTLSQGQTATFLVTVLSSSAPKFQWRRNGALLPGATAVSLSIPFITEADAGQYDVLVGNANGTVLSRPATLQVLIPAASASAHSNADAAAAPPRITTQPADLNLAPGEVAVLAIAAIGSDLSFQWKKNGVSIPGATGAAYTIPHTASADTGMYTVIVRSQGGTAESRAAAIAIITSGASRLTNLSTRGYVPPGGALTPGFSWRGPGSKNLLVRAIGPALSRFGVEAVLADPTLEIIPAGSTEVFAANDNWSTATQLPGFTVATAASGAFALDAGSKDAAILTTLATTGPRNYTARITSASPAAEGIVLAEVYDTDTSNSTSRLIAVSTLGHAAAGDRTLVPGFTIAGTAPKRLLIRAIGPGLAQFGVTETLSDPRIAVHAAAGTAPIATNDNWAYDDTTVTATARAGAFALTPGSNDAALVVVLPPGGYTATVSGAAGTSGTVLVEIYDLDP